VETNLAMTAFVRAVERNGFSPAARDLGVTPSAISKLVTRLERRLGVMLLHRTTRRLALTPEGELYFERAQRIVEAIHDAETEVMRFGERPRGKLRINVGTAFGTYVLVPALPEFLARYPEIELELALTDRIVDLVDVGADLAIRLGPLADSNLVARKLTTLTRVVVAAPAYLARRGTPRTPEALATHECLTLSGIAGQREWPFAGAGGGVRHVAVHGAIAVNNAETLYELALLGLGIIGLSDIIVGPAVRDGRLVPLLTDVHRPEALPLFAVYPASRHRPLKVAAMIDFLLEKCADPPWRIPPAALAPAKRRKRPPAGVARKR
jgi:DNA-binding transcriptional LysR family regulator